MATIASKNTSKGVTKSTATGSVKEFVFEWEGKDRKGKQVRGEIRAAGEAGPDGRVRDARRENTASA